MPRHDEPSEGGVDRHRWPLQHHGATALGVAMRLVPRRLRFSAARLLARMLVPFIARTQMCREQVAMGLDTQREIALYVVLRFLTRTGNVFDIPVLHQGREEAFAALTKGRGCLVALSHTTLCYAMCRDLADRGLDPVIVESRPIGCWERPDFRAS